MNTEKEHTGPPIQLESADGTSSSIIESAPVQPGTRFSLDLRKTPPRGISSSALSAAEIPAIPAVIRNIDEEGVLTARIELGEKQWNIEIPGSAEPLETLSEESTREFSTNMGTSALSADLDELLGVVPAEVTVGATISLMAYEYRGLESIEGVEPVEFERVKLLSRHNDQRSGNRLWTVEDQGQQKVLYVPELERTYSDDIARHVRIHKADPGFTPVDLPDVPQIKRELIYRFEPGWTVNVSGYQEGSATLDESERTRVTRVGKFVGYVDDIQVGDEPGLRLSLLVDGQLVHLDRTEYMDRNLITDGRFAVEIPVGYEPMSSGEVIEKYAKPIVVTAQSEAIEAKRKRVIPANQIQAGAVIVSKDGVRAEVLSARPVAKISVVLEVRGVNHPGQSQLLKVPAWKKFKVESTAIRASKQGTENTAVPRTDNASQEMSNAALFMETSSTALM